MQNSSSLDSLVFEFLIGGKLLRGQLKSHIVRYQISCEQTINIQYFIAFQPLQNQSKLQQDDWISTLSLIVHPEGNCFGVGLFSGVVTIYSQSNKQLFKAQVDDDAIKALRFLTSPTENSYYSIAGGLNEQIKVGFFNMNGKKVNYEHLSTTPHEGSILALDLNPIQDGHFCCAGNSGKLSIFRIPQNFQSDESNLEIKKKKKKVQLSQKILPVVACEKLHDDSINAVSWITQTKIVTGGADHCLKLIDVQKFRTAGTLLTKDSVTCTIDFSADRLLTGHQDGYIRLWDIRVPQTPINTYKGHSKFISNVQFNPNKSNLFGSTSYDSTVKIWDTRSMFPIQNIGTHHDKVFSLLWKQEKQLIAGGSDQFVSIHTV